MLRTFSASVDHNYAVLFFLSRIRDDTRQVETSSRGYIITKDSSFLAGMPAITDRIFRNVDSLKKLFPTQSPQYERSVVLKTITSRRLHGIQRNIERMAYDDTAGLHTAIMEGKWQMEQFTTVSGAIEEEEQQIAVRNRHNKELYELLTPGSFNIILIFSGLLTLVSFFFIRRQMHMRLRYQLELERRLNELNRSNAELEQFTYVASHHLQEPLRKIRTFSDRLLGKYSPSLAEEAVHMLTRIDVSARRTQELITDMVNFTNLVNRNDKLVDVDLNAVVEQCFRTLSKQIRERKPILKYDRLPVIKGYADQLALLFRALVENSIKFGKQEERPFVYIRYQKVEGTELARPLLKDTIYYHQVIVEDNGIGFDNEFAAKIFVIFQRLHNQGSPYRGKGIGLAVAQRVITNHNAIITAKGRPGEGASIYMYFPVESMR